MEDLHNLSRCWDFNMGWETELLALFHVNAVKASTVSRVETQPELNSARAEISHVKGLERVNEITRPQPWLWRYNCLSSNPTLQGSCHQELGGLDNITTMSKHQSFQPHSFLLFFTEIVTATCNQTFLNENTSHHNPCIVLWRISFSFKTFFRISCPVCRLTSCSKGLV